MFDLFKRKSSKKTVKVIRKTAPIKLSKHAFDAAQVNNLFSDWEQVSRPINLELESELRTMRARSRNLRKNDPYIKRFHQLCRSNIVGPNGFTFSSDVCRKNGKPAYVEREAIEKAWKRAQKKGGLCSLDKMTGIDFQNMIVDQVFGDAEVIIMETRGRGEGEFGISFKFIDPELLDVNHKDERGPYKVRMGLETDQRGRVIAYHFHSTDSSHQDYYTVSGRGYLRVPKNRIIHEFFIEFVGQLRGFPVSVAAMTRLKMLNGYEESELVAARVGSAAVGLIERGENGGGFDSADDMVEYEDEDIEVIEDSDPVIEMEPGFHTIDHGAKLHTFSTNHPTTAYKDYIKTMLRGIAAGLGVDYNTLANDLEGVNFSSLRGGVLESRELWKCAQVWIVDHVLIDVFERWLETALLMGAIRLPRGDALRASEIDRFCEFSFMGRRWAWVDPIKDLQAAKLAIDEGLASRSEIIRERGGDPDKVWDEIARENEIMAKKGVEIKSKPTESAMSNVEEEEESEDVQEDSE